jgi:hypothetical protein
MTSSLVEPKPRGRGAAFLVADRKRHSLALIRPRSKQWRDQLTNFRNPCFRLPPSDAVGQVDGPEADAAVDR